MQREPAIALLLNKVFTFISNPIVRNVVDSYEALDIGRDVLDKKRILFCRVSHGRLGKDAAEIISAVLTSQIWDATQDRDNRPNEQWPDGAVIVDEFHKQTRGN